MTFQTALAEMVGVLAKSVMLAAAMLVIGEPAAGEEVAFSLVTVMEVKEAIGEEAAAAS